MIDTMKKSTHRMQWSRLNPDLPAGVHEPKYPGDVGWDLEAMQDVFIPSMQARDVPVNARLHLPDNTWAEIRARSSIARRNLSVEAGTLDGGYRGPLFILVRNMTLPPPHLVDGDWDTTPGGITIKRGERVGQLVFYRMASIWMEEVEQISLQTDRSENGFGSSGK